jgi:hypothetical protein
VNKYEPTLKGKLLFYSGALARKPHTTQIWPVNPIQRKFKPI